MSFLDMLLRLGIAAFCGGAIGIERGKRRRAAGFRTHMLVCMGAALTMLLGIYLHQMIQSGLWEIPFENYNTDVSRFGAQVINGIGFIGAGTIIVTSRQQVKGMTTAAGLWAAACMGLAIGAGFYTAALIGCVMILLVIVVFSKLEFWIMLRARNINLYIEFENIDDLSLIMEKIKSRNVKIFDVEIFKPKTMENSEYPRAIFSLQLPKKLSHAALMTNIAELDIIRGIEEL